MDTSRSTEWSAQVHVFAGRPDPTWTVAEADAAALLAQWEGLASATAAAPSPPPLGYRGVTLRAGDGTTWHAYAGVVELRRLDDSVRRSDPQRDWERRLLATAPPGVLPPLDV
jgi:hypothetical protein